MSDTKLSVPDPEREAADGLSRSSTDAELELHPVARLFPTMTDEEFARLVDDVRAHGIKEPILVQNGTILDGQHRYRAARQLGIACPQTVWDGTNAWLEAQSRNLMRRNLRAEQIAAIRKIAERQFPAESAVGERERLAAKMRQRLHGGTAPGRTSNTSGHVTGSEGALRAPGHRPATRTPEAADRIGARRGISGSTQKRIDRLAREAPDQLELVARGDKGLLQALREANAAKAPRPSARSTSTRVFNFTKALARLSATLERLAIQCSPLQREQLIGHLHETADALAAGKRFR